jgi:hypothetical protein
MLQIRHPITAPFENFDFVSDGVHLNFPRQYMAAHPEEAEIFNQAMSEMGQDGAASTKWCQQVPTCASLKLFFNDKRKMLCALCALQ